MTRQIVPRQSKDSFAYSVTELKGQNSINKRNLETQLAGCFMERSVQHTLIRSAREAEKVTASHKAALEYLCSKGRVFNPAQDASDSFEDLDLKEADLSGGIFIGVSFNSSNLQGAKLERAILWKCSFQECNLNSVTFADPKYQVSWRVGMTLSPESKQTILGGLA